MVTLCLRLSQILPYETLFFGWSLSESFLPWWDSNHEYIAEVNSVSSSSELSNLTGNEPLNL